MSDETEGPGRDEGETEHLPNEKRRILAQALPDVPFDGWTQQILLQAVKRAGFDTAMAARAFPGGVRDLLDFHLREADREMLAAFADWRAEQEAGGRAVKPREQIAAAIRLRLDGQVAHREAIRRALSLLALPTNVPWALKSLYRTVDAIWYAAGDRATDFNFYTKRLMLAGVYGAVLACWIEDRSEGQAQTWAFLERRLDEVMGFGRFKKRLGEAAGRFPDPRRIFERRL